MTPARRHALAALDASKRFDLGFAAWAVGVTRALTPFLSRGDGAIAVPFGATQVSIAELSALHVPEQDLGAPLAEAYHQRVAALATPAELEHYFERTTLATYGATRLSGILAPEVMQHCEAAARDTLENTVDFRGVRVNAADGSHGILFSSTVGPEDHLGTPQRRLLCEVMRGIEADYRLRTELQGHPDGWLDPFAGADAVLDRAGGVLHRRDGHEGEGLDDATIALGGLERTLLRRSRADGEDVVKAWRGLVTGAWALLRVVDAAGDTFWVLRERSAPEARLRTLIAQERYALVRRLQGAWPKQIAAECGVSPSSVQNWLAHARQKLGLGDWAAVGAVLGRLPGRVLEEVMDTARRELERA